MAWPRPWPMGERDFHGLCFVNLVDFDMLYGHRRDVDGYARALTEFDAWLPGFLEKLGPEDLVMITADHGCDPPTLLPQTIPGRLPLVVLGPEGKAGQSGHQGQLRGHRCHSGGAAGGAPWRRREPVSPRHCCLMEEEVGCIEAGGAAAPGCGGHGARLCALPRAIRWARLCCAPTERYTRAATLKTPPIPPHHLRRTQCIFQGRLRWKTGNFPPLRWWAARMG